MNFRITSESLKNWMKTQGISRRELADILMVTKDTINGWCSKRPISPRTQEILRRLMMEYRISDPVDSIHNQNQGFPVTPSIFTDEQWDRICRAARLKNMSPATFVKMSVFTDCNRIIEETRRNNK